MFVILNGMLLEKEAAILSPFDRGFLLGDGVFTTLLAKEGKLECFDAHLKRLKQSTKVFSLPDPPLDLKEQILKLLENNQLTKGLAAVRVTISRGPGERGLRPPKTITPVILITATVYERLSKPADVIVSTIKRDKAPPLCHIKHLGYQASILAKLEAVERGCDDALMLNSGNNLVCSSAGNLFLVCKDRILTPPLSDGALPGIIRGKIIQHHKNINIQSLTIKDFESAEAAFITNSLIGIQMIASIENKPLNTKIKLNFNML